MSRNFARRHWIAIALSAAWLIGATLVLSHQRAVEIGRLIQQCHQLQDDAHSSALCGEGNSLSDQPLCRYKDADCDRWSLEEARYAKKIIWLAVAPVVLAWVISYGFVRFFRRRGRP